MNVRTQIRLKPDVYSRVKRKAAEEGMSVPKYLGQLAERHLAQPEPRRSPEAIDERIRARGPSGVRAQTVAEALREVRED